ncbi:hypothetical protein HOY80DRAFT_1136111 [Tuber brumale]|nr:hypothetical protein HOY80DRAFT_1136111 [Tuber brumale]
MHCLPAASRGLRGGLSARRLRTTVGRLGATLCSSGDVVGQGSPDAKCNAILLASSPFGTAERMKQDAKHSLIHALRVEERHIKSVKDGIFVGNSRGLDLVSLSLRLDTELASLHKTIATHRASIASLEMKIDSQEKKIASQEKKIASQEMKIASQEKKIASQEKKIATQKAELELTDSRQEERLRYLIHSHDSYKLMRNCFISTFKRKYFYKQTKADKKIVEDGNASVHGGDAIVDASLYAGPNGRTDFWVFKKLYGLRPKAMERITHEKTIHVLNTHASVLGSDR